MAPSLPRTYRTVHHPTQRNESGSYTVAYRVLKFRDLRKYVPDCPSRSPVYPASPTAQTRLDSCVLAQDGGPCGVPRPHLPYLLACDRCLDLVLQDHRIDTVTALHATKGLDAVFTGATQAVVPLAHEQACATSARSCRKLLACRKGSNDMPIVVLFHWSATLRIVRLHSPFHDSASRLLVRRDVRLASEHHCVFSRWRHCSSVT